MTEGYRRGDFWRICDECGVKTRSSQTRKRWDGAMVCMDDWEPQHPQDFVRGRADRQNVPDPRPDSTNFLPGDAYIRVSNGGQFTAENSGYVRVYIIPDEVTL